MKNTRTGIQWEIDQMIEDIIQAQSTISVDFRAYTTEEYKAKTNKCNMNERVIKVEIKCVFFFIVFPDRDC